MSWVCDSLPSPNSRKAYHDDLRAFVSHMAGIGVHPFDVTGDHVRLYKDAMVQAGRRPATIARALSVIRGTYEQFGKKRLVLWNLVGDIQAATARPEHQYPAGGAGSCPALHVLQDRLPIAGGIARG